jgi:hypothetical protein
MRRADDDAMENVWHGQIGDVAPSPPHEALVFKAVDAAAQQLLGHAKVYGTRGLQRQQQRCGWGSRTNSDSDQAWKYPPNRKLRRRERFKIRIQEC